MLKVWSLNLHKLIMQIFAYHCPRISIYQGPREGSYYALRFFATLHNFGIINNRTNHHIEQYNKNLECPFANCFCRVEQCFKNYRLGNNVPILNTTEGTRARKLTDFFADVQPSAVL